MAVGAGDAGSRLSLCGAPFVDYKVRAGFTPVEAVSAFSVKPFSEAQSSASRISLTACGQGLATSQHCHCWCLGKEKDIDMI